MAVAVTWITGAACRHTHVHTRLRQPPECTTRDGCRLQAGCVRLCVCMCVSIGLTEHTDRGLARVGLTNQDRTKQTYIGMCVCVCHMGRTFLVCGGASPLACVPFSLTLGSGPVADAMPAVSRACLRRFSSSRHPMLPSSPSSTGAGCWKRTPMLPWASRYGWMSTLCDTHTHTHTHTHERTHERTHTQTHGRTHAGFSAWH